MNDSNLLRGFVLGTAATLLLFVATAAFGHLPVRSVPKLSCICPDSTTITQPRSLETKPRN